MKEIHWKRSFGLFWYFFRIGWFTFGGGWSIVAQMQKDFVEKKKELTENELLDIVSVGRSLPGTMIGNVAYLFGYHQEGVLGGILAVLGMITPSILILTVLTYCYTAFSSSFWVGRALVGVRSAVVPIIFTAALKLKKGALVNPACYVLCIVGCILSAGFGVNCVLIVLMGIVAGVVLGRWQSRKEQVDA